MKRYVAKYSFITGQVLFFLLCPLLSFGQKEGLKVLKINATNYPRIEVLVKTAQKVDTTQLRIVEQGKEQTLTAKTLPSHQIKDPVNILFSVDYDLKKRIASEVDKIFRRLPVGSKINVAYRLPKDSMHVRSVYLSPAFSKNYSYFRRAMLTCEVDANHLFSKDYDVEDRQKVEEFLIAEAGEQKTVFIYILTGKETWKTEGSDLLSGNYGSAYFIVLPPVGGVSQEKMIEESRRTGGMFTVCPAEQISKTLYEYLEDIDLQGVVEREKVCRITFQSQQGEGKNVFDLYYGNQKYPLHFTAAAPHPRTQTEIILFCTTALLIVWLFFLQYKRLFGKYDKTKKSDRLSSPIEISVRTPGFNKNYFFEKYFISIGRNPENDIVIPNTTVSATHAVIHREKSGFFVQDTGSTNGVLLNERKIDKKRLHSGDKLKLGSAILVVIF